MENIKLSDQELEKIDAEVMNAISGGNAFTDKSQELATKASKAFMALPKGVRFAGYTAMALATAEAIDWGAFKGKGTQAAIHGVGYGLSKAGEGTKWLGDKMYKADIARKTATSTQNQEEQSDS